MFTELTVIVKDSEKTLRKKFPVYEVYQCDPNDQIIKNCVEETLVNFGAEPEHIEVKITMDIK